MTLFIACLLIYHFNMEWWWYLLATIIWGCSILAWSKIIADETRRA